MGDERTVVMQIQVVGFSTDERLYRFSLPLPGTEREIAFQMEISFVNVNVSYKKVTCTPFSEIS